ncbi:hypothetical protein [Rufibacter sp. XAAS-G3-1]|uniref:hypothetical protein n=1 Tax=Rufibacter sp. XAAS-G3-1 TaxID=2729134 RepID=UPI0015E6503E|nr:hypothetical protein [Rufibacter sp. XAAS-G3-1]
MPRHRILRIETAKAVATYKTYADLGDCDRQGCRQKAVSYNADGEKLCEPHLVAWNLAGGWDDEE